MRLLTVTVALLLLVFSASHDIEKRQTRRLRARPPGARRRNPGADPSTLVSDPTPPGKRVVCYYTNWSVYRSGAARFYPQNINPYLCTHLVYAFGGLTDEFELSVFDSYQDIDKNGYSQFNSLKQYNKNLRTLLAVGGWNEGSARFSELVSFPESRRTFVESALRHLRRYNFDGLDLDWEYPAARDGAAPEDKENYALLVKELRTAFEEESQKSNKPRLLLTMAVPAGENYINNGYDVPTLNKYLDFFNLLTYDYHIALEPFVRHHAPLLALPDTSEYEETYKLNVDYTVKHFIKLGADKMKLVVGIPTYGRAFELADPAFNDYESSAIGPALAGNYTNEPGFLAFYEICEAMSVDGWEAKKPYPRTLGPYAYKGNQWVGYDDEGAASLKAEYVRDTGLGGIMFWSLDTDDFRGVCNGQKYLLIESAKASLLADPMTALEESPVTPSTPVTPIPPTTPSPIPVFACKKEGFHPNPDNCHQYFWCLKAGGGSKELVAHTFTCPSGLVFSKTVDGCEHPDRAKCKEKKNRGGATETKPEDRIPTTTPFPKFDYDYYYYYDADYLNPILDSEVVDAAVPDIETNVIARNLDNSAVRNSGGPQFLGSPAEKENAVDEGSEVSNGRVRPQYSTISRDTPTRAEAASETDDGGISNARQRPQYTVLNRARQPTEATPPEEESATNAGDRLNYVTIERRRPVQSRQEEEETVTQPGRQYVTLNRSDRRTTESPVIVDDSLPNLISVDASSFRQRPERQRTTTEEPTTTSTTTTTSRPARIVVPDAILNPVDLRPNLNLPIDPRKKQQTDTTPVPDYLYEYYYYDDYPDATSALEIQPKTAPELLADSEPAEAIPQEATVIENLGREEVVEEATSVAPIEEPTTTTPKPSSSTVNLFAEFSAFTTTEETVKDLEVAPEVTRHEETQTEEVPQTTTTESSRRFPKLPPIPTRAPSTGDTTRPIRTRPDVRRPSNRFTSQRATTEEPDAATRRSFFQRPTSRDRTPSRTNRPRFRPREEEDTTVREEETEARELEDGRPNRNRFSSRPITTNRQRLTPIPVTESSIPQRPATADRINNRPANRIKFGRTTTEEPIEEVTEEMVPETTLSSILPTTEIFDFIEEIPSIQDRVLPEQREDPARSTTPSVEKSPTINFQDLFAPETSRPLIEFQPTTPPTTTRSPFPTRTSTSITLETSSLPPQTRRPVPQTRRPVPQTTTQRPSIPRRGSRPLRPRVSTARPASNIADYEHDYFYEDNGALGGTLGELADLTEKALLLPDGNVQCYDTGYFAHPDSCKKFISCAKTVRGAVRGWVYTCPQQLVFDPVGGMCNWAEAVDCKAPII